MKSVIPSQCTADSTSHKTIDRVVIAKAPAVPALGCGVAERETAAPVTENAAPVTENPAPVTENPAPVMENAAPVTESVVTAWARSVSTDASTAAELENGTADKQILAHDDTRAIRQYSAGAERGSLPAATIPRTDPMTLY